MEKKIILTKEKINEYSNIGDVFLLLLIHNNCDIEESYKSLIKQGYITAKRDENLQPIGWNITNKGIDLLNNIIIDSTLESNNIVNNDIQSLCQELKNIFPKGKKEGTNLYWSDSIQLIEKRLNMFTVKYGKYSNEDIINATRSYVSSFNGNYKIMRLLKYFILKEDRKNGLVESTSDLLNLLENKEESQNNDSDFMSELK